jgi:hypothetical protein
MRLRMRSVAALVFVFAACRTAGPAPKPIDPPPPVAVAPVPAIPTWLIFVDDLHLDFRYAGSERPEDDYSDLILEGDVSPSASAARRLCRSI